MKFQITKLKAQLNTKEAAKVESLVKIDHLRKEARAMLRLEPLERDKDKKVIPEKINMNKEFLVCHLKAFTSCNFDAI